MKDFAGNEINVPAVLAGIAAIDWAATTDANPQELCETCQTPIEKRRGIWQHINSRLIRCDEGQGHAYPNHTSEE
jgi:hypothetical protein